MCMCKMPDPLSNFETKLKPAKKTSPICRRLLARADHGHGLSVAYLNHPRLSLQLRYVERVPNRLEVGVAH
jgi:hypothetical protein